MDFCSICMHSLTGLIYRFEQCSTHIFCFNCFTAKKQIEDLKCNDCNRDLNIPSLKNFSQSCFYCKTQSTLLTCENKHKLCIDCIQNRETGVECYYCYIRIFTYCSSCQTPLTLKTPIPEHPCHSKCSECFRIKKQNSDCFECIEENSIKRNLCYLCHKRPVAIKLCHGLCVQCCIILLIFKAENYKQIGCNQCITGINFIDLTNVCSVCGSNNNDSIPIIACLKNHMCCLKCFKGKVSIKNIACRDCRVYFKLKVQNKINCCTICYYDSSLVFKKMCRSHYICAKCSEKIFKLSIEKQKKLINCQGCLNLNNLDYELVPINVINYEKCFFCNKNLGLEIGCPLHKFCKKCLMFEMINILKKSGDCVNCNNFNYTVCRMCLNVTDKPRPLKCPYEHVYCLSCIMQKANFLKTRNEICEECSTIVLNESHMKNQRCIQCRIQMNPSSNCSEHSICSDCLLNSTYQINQTFKNCRMCSELLEKYCFNCLSGLTDKNKLFFPTCVKNHFYCRSCFNDLILKESFKCSTCSIKIKKNDALCDLCFRREPKSKLCASHSFCDICMTNLKKEVGISLKCLLVCSLCRENIKNLISHKTSEPNLNNHNQTPLPIIRASQNTGVNINRQIYPKLKSSQGAYFNPPINQESVYNNDKASTRQNYHNPIINPSGIQTEAVNNWILKEMSEHLEVVKHSLIPPQENQIIFHNQANQNFISDYSQPIALTNTDSNSYLQGSSNINKPNSACLFNIPKIDVKYSVPYQEHKIYCFKCKNPSNQLVCTHANCFKCFSYQFNSNFSSFIVALTTNNVLALNVLSFHVCCLEPTCNKKYNILLETYWENAYSIISPYFEGNQELSYKFLMHYKAFFEGAKYNYAFCDYCHHLVGKNYNQLCLWCNY